MGHIIQTSVCAFLLIVVTVVSGFTRYNFSSGNNNTGTMAYLNAVSTGKEGFSTFSFEEIIEFHSHWFTQPPRFTVPIF